MTSQAVYCLSLQIRPPSDENNDGLITNQKDTTNSMSNKQNLDKLTSSGIDIEVKNSSTSTYKLNNRNKSIQIQQQKHQPHHQHTSASIGTSTTSSLSSTSLTKTLNIHHQQQQQQQQQQQHHQINQQQQQQQHSNIILVRGARTENGQIILQNSHELLSLLNGATTATIQNLNDNDSVGDNNKSIILQHQRIKTTTTSSSTQSHSLSSGITKIQCDSNNTIGSNGGTVLLQSTTNFKKNLLSDGSIILQQRLNKSTSSSSGSVIGSSIVNNDTVQQQHHQQQQQQQQQSSNNCGNSISVNNGGPFLLQTLKRLDKSQSILVFRNPNNNAATVLSSASIGTSTTSGNNNCQSSTSSSISNLSGGTTLTLTTTSNPIISGLTTTKSSIKNNNNNNNTSSSSSSSIALAATTTGFSQRITTTKSANININKNNNNQNNNNNNNNNNSGGVGVNNNRNQNCGNGNNSGNVNGNRGNCNDIQDKTETRSQQKQMNVPLGSNGEPIKLPDNLESLPRADQFPTQRHRWNTNEEIAAILISFDKHSEWQSKEVRTRPKSGSLLLYSRKKVRYRRDGYCWKKRKDGKTTREDHMKLKVQGTECIYGCYVHSAILPTFHRRCYWLLQNPDIVLVHYLNVPYPDDNKMAIITPSLSLWGDKKEWTKEELVSQLKPMFFSEDDPDSGNDIEISTAETVEAIVSQLMEKQRLARQAALVKQLECGCPDSTCADGKSCAHPMRRIGGPSGGNTKQDKQQRQVENNNQVTSTTPNVLVGPRFYSRWVDRRNRGNETDLKSSQLDNSTIQFQVIPSIHAGHSNSISNHHHQQQQQHHQHQQQQQHILSRQHNSNQLQQLTTNNNNSASTSTNPLVRSTNQPQQQQQQQQQSSFTNASNQGNQINRITNNNISQIIINTNSNTNHNNGNSSSTAIFSNCISDGGGGGVGGGNLHNNSSTSTTTIITTNNNNSNNNSTISSNNQLPSHSNSHQQHHHHQQQQKITLQNSSDNNLTNDGGNHHHHHHLQQNHLTMATSGGGSHQTSVNSSNSNSSSTSSTIIHHHHHQQPQHLHSQHHQQHQQQSQQQQQQSIIDSNIVNQRISSNLISNSSLGRSIGVSCTTTNNSVVNSAPPLVLNLSQISGSGNSLLILNGGQQQSFVCQTSSSQQPHQRNNPNMQNLIPKIEKIDTKPHHFTDNVFDDITFATTSTSASTEHPLASDKHQQNNLVKDLNDSLPFFNETLDLSQEDIQKTLIANMPVAHSVVGSNGNGGGGGGSDDIDTDINPMDFIDNVCDVDGVVGGTNNDLVIDDSNGCVGLINDVHDPDDVFVNLDAFDMFVEFPELDLDSKTNFETNITDAGNKTSEAQLHQSNVSSETAGNISNANCNNSQIGYNITDYSPEWAYPEGGVKVLVTGPWNSTATYTVLFDAFPVKTTVVQDGVLRCFCPAHEVGLATLQVACDGVIVSNSVIFEYKSPPNIETAFDGAASESLYKFTLLNRLSSIDEKMQIKTEPKEIPEESALISEANFEERLVNYCQHLTNKVWRPISPTIWPISYKGMTLLHLASALGYTKLVCAMLTWRSDNPNLILETEIDALSRDIIGFTPLAWACARGHCETAIILYKWNHNSINIENNFQQNPLDLAKQNGYTQLIGELKRLEKLRISCQTKNQSSSLALNRFTKDTTPNNNNNHNTNNNLNNNSNSNNNNENLINNPKNINKDNNNSNLTRTYDESSNNSSPIDENSNSSSNGSSTITTKLLDNNDENGKNNNETNGSNRSHDGVFLRPGAVSSSQSPPSARISKRSSVDSGINMDIRSYSRSGKIFKDHNRFQSGLDSNDSFSLSMDSNFLDNGIGMSSGSSGTLLSPMRKMDFALCEISASDSSCSIQDIQPSCSLSDDEDIKDQNLMNDNGGVCVGESDAKVLTLAEHIIAAMPDRIKNESEDIMSLGSPMSESLNTDGINDAFMEPLLDSLPSSQFDHELTFEFSDNSYRYHDVSTPCSSLSPASSGPLQSPASYSILQEPTMNSPSPPPSAKELTEFLHASNMSSQQRPFEADFSKLTLTDREQRELYEAAKCIQKAYRSYKGRKKLEEQDKERSAAIVIQNYYRRYKQFAYYKQMTHAALVIQNGYRSYCANKRFKKSQNHTITPTKGTIQDSQCLQNYYKNYQNDQQQQLQNQMSGGGGTTSKEPSPSGPLKRTYSQRTQNQAARKIQQFMRQSKMKLQRERAEKERLVHQRREEYLQNLQYLGQPEIVTQEQNEKPKFSKNPENHLYNSL